MHSLYLPADLHERRHYCVDMPDQLTFPSHSILTCPEALAFRVATMWTGYYPWRTPTTAAAVDTTRQTS